MTKQEFEERAGIKVSDSQYKKNRNGVCLSPVHRRGGGQRPNRIPLQDFRNAYHFGYASDGGRSREARKPYKAKTERARRGNRKAGKFKMGSGYL